MNSKKRLSNTTLTLLRETSAIRSEIVNNDVFTGELYNTALKIKDVFRNNGKLLIFGHGNLKYKAIHFFEELVGFYKSRREPVSALYFELDHLCEDNLRIYRENGDFILFFCEDSFLRTDIFSNFHTETLDILKSSCCVIGTSLKTAAFRHSLDFLSPSTLPRYSIVTFLLHVLCEVFEPLQDEFSKSRILEMHEERLNVENTILTSDQFAKELDRVEEKLLSGINEDAFVVPFGNGGSSCDAMEFIALLKLLSLEKKDKKLRVTDIFEPSYITCVSNDTSYDSIVSRFVKSLAPNPVMIVAFTTSGNSRNIVDAFQNFAKEATTLIAITGNSGGKVIGFSDSSVVVPSSITELIQEIHDIVMRGICLLIENRL